MSLARTITSNAILAVVGIVFAFTLGEIGFRLYFKFAGAYTDNANSNPLYVLLANSRRVYGNRPRVEIGVNSMGFRGPEFSIEKTAGVTRIIMLGDSITFGDHVEYDQTIPYYLEQHLNAKAGERRFEILNLGVDGYNSEQELATLQDVGLRLTPDFVVLNICLNDSDPVKHVLAAGLLNVSAKISRISDINLRSIVGSSYLLTYLKDRFLQLVVFPLAPDLISTLNDPRHVINKRISETAWSDMKQQMLEIARLSAVNRAGFLAVVYPYRPQLGLPREELLPQRDLIGFFATHEIATLDVMPAIELEGAAAFVDPTAHLSPTGSRAAATAIGTALSLSMSSTIGL